jgi:ribosomal-protein-alanine N-acetyltransferase
VLATLHAACFAEEPWRTEAMAEVLAMPGAFGFLAGGRRSACGFLVALDLGQECEILTLGVLPNRRRRGIAGRLMERLLAVAGGRQIVLEVAEDNRPALVLYEGLGFAEVGRRPAYYRRAVGPAATALVMHRPQSA